MYIYKFIYVFIYIGVEQGERAAAAAYGEAALFAGRRRGGRGAAHPGKDV